MTKAKELIELVESLDSNGYNRLKNLAKQIKETDRAYDEEYIKQLYHLKDRLNADNEFKVGQMVKWKKGLKNKRLPHEDQPAIIMEIFEKPIFTELDPGTPYFHEPLDLVLGFIGDHNDFIVFHYDKRRFEPFNPK